MEIEKQVTFFLTYEDRERTLQLLEYDTVGNLKTEIHHLFGVPVQNQLIHGWETIPDTDDTILLQVVRAEHIICLDIKKSFPELKMDNNANKCDRELEEEASLNFINKILMKKMEYQVTFHSCTLTDAIAEACLPPNGKRKVLLLYFHNEDDTFSSIFFEYLRSSNVTEILNRSFFLLGWDVCNTKYQNALIKSLSECSDLSNLIDLVKCKVAAALYIVPIKDSLTIFSIIRGKISDKDFLETLIQSENFLITENEQEQKLERLVEKSSTANDFGSVNYQKLMADMLGDRDYDSFEYNEHEPLKKKIAFALMGPPQQQQGYDSKSLTKVNSLFDIILNNSNKISKDKDRVEISFIYNCTEPLPAEKLKRSKKYPIDYNPNTDVKPVPLFILRKCHGSNDPCRVFVDDIGRTYETWQEYLTRNKLHKCEMVLPLNGRYEVDLNGEVLLERHLSPACGVDAKVLQGTDYVSTAGGLLSGGVFVAAAIPAVTVAPAALVTAGVVGLGVGIYSIGRSAYTLYDRIRHKESLSFANSEARGAYLNIIAGSLGFVGAGANVAVSQLAARGVNIGKGAGAVVNTINVANIGASGFSVLNSGYDVFDQWYSENQTPSWLTIIQLSSSVLFFGNAVYSFKMCSTIVEETQVRTLQDYQESLRSNRHRKTFSKLLKETVRQNNGNEVQGRAEVISAIRNIQNKDEVFAVLTRSNKEMNKNGIKFAAVDGEITLNGIKIDMNDFMSMNKKDAKTFLLNLPNTEPTPAETRSMGMLISNTFNNFSIPDLENLAKYATNLLYFVKSDTKTKILTALAKLLSVLAVPIKRLLDEIFPNQRKFLYLIDMIIGYFKKVAENLEEQYKNWINTNDDRYYNPLFQCVNMEEAKRIIEFVEIAVDIFYGNTEEGLKKLLNYFYNWLTIKIYNHEQSIERENRRREHSARSPTRRVPCLKCGGYYYKQL